MTTIRRLPVAIADVDNIWDYVAIYDPRAANRLVTRIVHSTDRLIDFPHSGSPRIEIDTSARSIVVDNYVIFYRVTGDVVEIVRVVHMSRDLNDIIADFRKL